MAGKKIELSGWDGLSAEDALKKAATDFKGRLLFASSLGKEDQAIAHMICSMRLPISIATLDTGRLFPETYDLIERTEELYGIRIKPLHPDGSELEAMTGTHGVNLFRRSRELRGLCCKVRKLDPLRDALASCDAWICGLRKAQSDARVSTSRISWDEAFGLWKICPISDWDDATLEDYISSHEVPINPLHSKGFPSIGCACCTRAVPEGADPRSGRWWWEDESKRECGLHLKPSGKPVNKGEAPL